MRVFALTLAALLALVVVVNALGAWTAWREEARVQAVPGALRPGQAVVGYRNVDERRFQRARLRVVPRPRVVAFGSSRVMQATGAMVGVGRQEFYNLGMSGATVEDYVGLWEVLRRQDKLPELALFSLDPWIFNAELVQVRWRALAREVESFGAGRGRGWEPLEAAAAGWTRVKELVSYEVLRDSAWRLRRAARDRPADGGLAPGAAVAEAAVGDHQALRADGSLIYESAFRRRGLDQVRDDAVQWASSDGAGLGSFRWNTARAERLEALWRRAAERGVRVVAYTPPYHPAAWRVLEADPRQRDALGQVRAAVRDVAERTGVRFADFMDPATVPCAEEEFFDGQHPRPVCLERLLRRLQAGGAGAAPGMRRMTSE